MSLGPCEEFTGKFFDKDGYGRTYNPRTKRQAPAHRKAYEDHWGVVLEPAEVVRHKCDNVRCVRPSHLVVGTQADNIADKVARGRCAVGEDNGQATVGNEVVDMVRKLYTGERGQLTELARRFGVSRVSIKNWVSGRYR